MSEWTTCDESGTEGKEYAYSIYSGPERQRENNEKLIKLREEEVEYLRKISDSLAVIARKFETRSIHPYKTHLPSYK